MKTRINLFEKGQKAVSTLFGTNTYLKKSSIEKQLLELVDFRVSQINQCAFCLDMHSKELRALGETEQRIYGLSAWKESPFYTARERAAFAWAEAVTEVRTTDEAYEQALSIFSEEELIDLTLAITSVNTWNRLNIAFYSPVGTYKVGMFG